MKNEASRTWIAKGLVTAFVLALLGFAIFGDKLERIIPSREQRALPNGASEIDEFKKSSFTGDYVLMLRARISEDQVASYAKALDLQERYSATNAPELPREWRRLPPEYSWWDPPSTIEGSYFRFHKYEHDHAFYMLLGYKNGYVYLTKTVH